MTFCVQAPIFLTLSENPEMPKMNIFSFSSYCMARTPLRFLIREQQRIYGSNHALTYGLLRLSVTQKALQSPF